jgi:enolase
MTHSKIVSIEGREILDSRGNPTIEGIVTLEHGIEGRFMAPSGASTGTKEAIEMRDADPARYHGKGVTKAIEIINTHLSPALVGKNAQHQEEIDRTMIALDGTNQKQRFGGNAILAISGACTRAAALALHMPLFQYIKQHLMGENDASVTLPTPLVNIANGGMHAGNNLDIQEFQLIPVKKVPFHERLRMMSETFHEFGALLESKGMATGVGDEGGYSVSWSSTTDVLDGMMEAIARAGYKPGNEIAIGLDVAASSFYKNGNYHFEGEQVTRTSEELNRFYEMLASTYPLVAIEDPFAEDDWEAWSAFMRNKPSGIKHVIGDDLLTTNVTHIQRAIDEQAANAVLVKPNQIGTITETLEAIAMAKKHNMAFVISHRSGDTEDSFIADLAVGTSAPYIKTGSMSRSERIAKYNRLLDIERLFVSSTITI